MFNLGTAVCAWLLLWFWHRFRHPLGGAGVFLNFVPVLGNILMMIPGLARADTDRSANNAARGNRITVINTVIGNVLEPRIMGKGLGSPTSDFISLLFWGWLFRHRGHVPRGTPDRRRRHRPGREPPARPLAILLGREITEGATPECGLVSPNG